MICQKCKSSLMFIKENKGKSLYCKKCGNVQRFFLADYKNYHNERYAYKFERNEKNDPLIRKIMETMNFSAKDKVLDYGCGSGDITQAISTQAPNVIGVDINVANAKKKYKEIDFREQKNQKLNFADNYFDKIVCVNVIEHVHDYYFLLKEFKRVLKENGEIFITSYDKDFILHSVLNDPTHVIEWKQKEFESLISREFKIKKSFKYGSFFNYRGLNWFLVKILKPELCIYAKN